MDHRPSPPSVNNTSSTDNGTHPVLAHSNTREHAFTNFLAWLKTEAIKVHLRALKKGSLPWSQRFASLACMDTLMHYLDTLNTDTTLESDDTQANAITRQRPLKKYG